MQRTKQFALRVMKLVDVLPGMASGRAIGKRRIRSGVSVGANYRDASGFGLELNIDGDLLKPDRVTSLLGQAGVLTAIMAASRIAASR